MRPGGDGSTPMAEHEFGKENPPHDGDHGTGAEKDPRLEGQEENTTPGAGDQEINGKPHPLGGGARKSRGRKSRDGYPCGERYDENTKFLEVYYYPKADRTPYGMVKRTDQKQFPQFHYKQVTMLPDTNDPRNWSPGAPKGPKVLYNLPVLSKAAPDAVFYISEGEKDADTLIDLGFLATCNSCGATYVNSKGELKGWALELNEPCKGHPAILFEDNDRDGVRHVQTIAEQLSPYCPSIKIVRFRKHRPKFDVTDWVEEMSFQLFGDKLVWNHTTANREIMRTKFLELLEEAVDYQPKIERDGRLIDNYDFVPDYAEDVLAQEVVQLHGESFRYVEAWGKWFVWDGVCWREDDTGRVIDQYIRVVCYEKADRIGQQNTKNAEKLSAKLLSSATIHSVRKLAQSIPPVASTVDQWDKDPWLLNTPDGVVDLRTGELREHCHDDYMTKITEVAPDWNCPTPLFDSFIDRIMKGDQEFIAYAMRVFGYSLTGLVNEHVICFGYGEGRNGKGVLLNTVGGLMNDYSVVAPITTFIVSKHEQHPTDLASLRGARFVRCSEVEKGHQWAEAKIKLLSGGDPIKARFMRQDFFTYQPQFKLFIIGNHKPSLRTVDEAIKGRMQMWPFDVVIPEKERDKMLEEKLKAERPGILAKMIDGCMEWQRIGLKPPQCVIEKTAEYMQDQDSVAEWFKDCIELDVKGFEPIQGLFDSWTQWATRAGEWVGKRKEFKAWFEKRGYKEERKEKGIGFAGLKLKPTPM
jgi:putative DNA primase/helicase